MEHLVVLQVILPLIAAPICLLIPDRRIVWLFSLLVSFATLAISLLLVKYVVVYDELVYAMGGFSAPIGIEYRIDALNVYLLVLVSFIASLVLLGSKSSIEKEISDPFRQRLFYIAFLLCQAGLLGILATGDAFNVFVFLEISSLSSYTLIALGNDRRALFSSFQYLIMGTIGATFILIGIGFMYMMTGTLNMHDLSERLPEVASTRTVFVALSFFIVGVCLKLALFPLHMWLPNAYAFSPSMVTVLLSATATKVAIYVLIRFVFDVFGFRYAFETLPLESVFLVLALFGILTSSVVAIYQENVKRLLAYSSVAQIGYMILGFSMGTGMGLLACLVHMFNHALMKAALFFVMAAVYYRIGSVNIQAMEGLGKTMPLTMAGFVVAGLSLIGVPLTAGFISKWYLLTALLDKGWWFVAVLVLVSSLLALIYIWKIIEVAYFRQTPEGTLEVKEAPVSILLPLWTLALANIYMGIDTGFTVGLAQIAVQQLTGGLP